jgi:multicomponent Na+:H+ antiporter subunit G
MKLIGEILLLIGSAFLFLGSLGLVRMPDMFNRLQAGTKASTLGAMTIALSSIFLLPGSIGKAILIVAFIAFSNPVASNSIARSAYGAGVPFTGKTKRDDWQEAAAAASAEATASASGTGNAAAVSGTSGAKE